MKYLEKKLGFLKELGVKFGWHQISGIKVKLNDIM